jgi:xanthine/uracil permease
LPLSVIIFLVPVVVLPASLIMAWRAGPGRGRVLAIVLAMVSGIALAVLIGLFLFAIAINQAWSSG